MTHSGHRDGQDDGQASAHDDGIVLHHRPIAHAQGNDRYRELRCFLKRLFPARLALSLSAEVTASSSLAPRLQAAQL